MEDCEGNEGWCFREAVGRSLPGTFFAYEGVRAAPRDPLAPMGDEAGLVGKLGNLTVTESEMGASGVEEIVQLAVLSEQDYYALVDGNCTTASVGRNSTDTSGAGAGAGKRGLGMGRRVHQEAIAERRWARVANAISTLPNTTTNSTTTSPSPSTNATDPAQPVGDPSSEDSEDSSRTTSLSSSQTAISLGYSDGFTTSKIFAQYGLSRLGFVGQYILDSLTELLASQVIDAAHEEVYTTWFLRGLADGEAQITAAVGNVTAVYSHS